MAGRDKRLLPKAGNEIYLEIEMKKKTGILQQVFFFFFFFELFSPVGFADANTMESGVSRAEQKINCGYLTRIS